MGEKQGRGGTEKRTRGGRRNAQIWDTRTDGRTDRGTYRSGAHLITDAHTHEQMQQVLNILIDEHVIIRKACQMSLGLVLTS